MIISERDLNDLGYRPEITHFFIHWSGRKFLFFEVKKKSTVAQMETHQHSMTSQQVLMSLLGCQAI